MALIYNKLYWKYYRYIEANGGDQSMKFVYSQLHLDTAKFVGTVEDTISFQDVTSSEVKEICSRKVVVFT